MKVILVSLSTSKEGITIETFGERKRGSLLWRLLTDPSERTFCAVTKMHAVYKWHGSEVTWCTLACEKLSAVSNSPSD